MISNGLKSRFESIIEFENVSWTVIDNIVQSDANILRPIKGVAFEEFFKKMLRRHFPVIDIREGVGDSDVDLYLNGYRLQLKTHDKGSTREGQRVGVALHKTHGNETRPHNLYSARSRTFDFLIVLHPGSGILVIPHSDIPEHNSWSGYLDDPAKFNWESSRINNWGLLGLPTINGVAIDDRTPPIDSSLPFLSSATFLEDHEIIETLCRPENFRAAVMGLKGNIKEHWFEEHLRSLNYEIRPPLGAYPKYDLEIDDSNGVGRKIQTKGTSKRMCDRELGKIGVEIMGTHGQFPNRGYTKRMFDYVAVIISSSQLPERLTNVGPHFIILPVNDLPLHYRIGNGEVFNNLEWNKIEFSDVIYPNIKLKLNMNNVNDIEFIPDLSSYGKFGNFDVIPAMSPFRIAGPYKLDAMPNQFRNLR